MMSSGDCCAQGCFPGTRWGSRCYMSPGMSNAQPGKYNRGRESGAGVRERFAGEGREASRGMMR